MAKPSDRTTPVREQFGRSADGLIHVGDTDLTYSDGSESAVFRIISESTDLSSSSIEMLERARTWAERYHTHPDRANVIRGLDLPVGATILEIGSGCGGVTRYLGEKGALVDALEPMPARARVARERTRDLPNVEVIVGELDDLPAGASYDVVVVIGVLEYVGLGTDDPAPYESFIRSIYERLNSGGTLVLAIENQLGVKYLVGAPEDHTSQIFDSLEGYPRGEGARTFSRAVLHELFTRSGFSARTLAAFPDYKLTQTLIDTDAAARHPSRLMEQLPSFPSPDWSKPRPRLASERLAWRQFVRAGLAGEVANSFVVLASKGTGQPVWPHGRIAVSFAVDTAPGYASVVTVSESTDKLGTSSTTQFIGQLHGSPSGEAGSGISRRTSSDFPADGVPIAEILPHRSPDERRALLSEWQRLLVDAIRDGGAPIQWDVRASVTGELTGYSGPLRADTLTPDAAIARALLELGLAAGRTAPPGSWPGATTVEDVVTHFAALLGLDSPGWLDLAVMTASRLRSVTSTLWLGAAARDRWEAELRRELATDLSSTELGIRVFDEAPVDNSVELRAALSHSQDMLAEAQREVERLRLILGPRRSRIR